MNGINSVKKNLMLLLTVSVFCSMSYGQLAKISRLNSGTTASFPQSNSINDIVVYHDSVWLGTEKGLSLATQNGTRWTNFGGTAPFDTKGISAIAVNDNILWVATGYNTNADGESIQTGGGFFYTTNRGTSWTPIPQPVDVGSFDTVFYSPIDTILSLAITVPQQNITFDMALTKNTVWTASWAGMLRKSTDNGVSWKKVLLPPDNLNSIKPTDTLQFHLSPRENYNHLVFSVIATNDSTLWVGTANGINKSTDGGISWAKFNHGNQDSSISGNWVIALHEQVWNGNHILWAGTQVVDTPEVSGVSYTTNGGASWKTALLGEAVHNIASHDSIVYVATDDGVFRSVFPFSVWTQNGLINDATGQITQSAIYAVADQSDSLWVGGSDGTALAYNIVDDTTRKLFNATWKLFRTYEQIGTKQTTYSYPCPFSPGNELVRLHYSLAGHSAASVTIRIFDFGMLPVKTVIQNVSRAGGNEYDELWDGRGDNKKYVANGVYFYRVEIENSNPIWGKVFVIR
jgi:ligand-binding sensor domain-containing protein